MHIDVQGSGPDLVLIHGWAMHGGIFAPLTDLLRAQFRVHIVDLPGHGRGRGVALRAALDHPANVRALVMIASSPRFVTAADWPHGVEAGVFDEFAAELQVHYRHAIERFLALETMGSAHAQTELRDLRKRVFERGEPNAGALRDALRELDSSDLRDGLAHLLMPSLWIAGRRDRMVPPAAMAWSAAHAPHGRSLEFNSGHAPFIGYAGQIATAIDAFATELPA